MAREQQGVAQSRDRWHAVPRTLSFVLNGGDVLLLRGAPTKRIWPNQYNGLGGHIERDEGVYASAAREIHEESGLLVHDLRLRGITVIDAGDPHTGILMFAFTALSDSRTAQPSGEGALEWVPRDQLADYDLVEDLRVILPHILAMPDDAPPYSARYSYDAEDRLVIEWGALQKPGGSGDP
jgi:8-oxo-dGTP diphosphatase